MRITRRKFLGTAAVSTAGLAFARPARSAEPALRLAFSTLGCPAWEWLKILEFAAAHGFAAIELRGLLGNMDLPGRPEFAPERLAQTKRELAAHGLKIACVSSSAEMHHADPTRRKHELEDAKRFLHLAEALESPFVRVFGNKIEGPRPEVVARIASALHELGEYAGPLGASVILESHGDFTDSPTLKEVLSLANSPHVGLLWDAHHTFVSGHEEPERTVAELGPWIRHTHLKDSVPSAKGRKYVLTGQGVVPVRRQMEALRKTGYSGFYCFEWEKVWHPDLEEPEVAFPDFARVMTGYLREL